MRFRRPPNRFALVPAVLAGALLAGCGGGGGGSSESTAAKPPPEEVSTLTKAELIRQGDSVCGEVNTAVGSTANSAADTESRASQTANLYIEMVQSLKELGQPSETEGYAEFEGAAEGLAEAEEEVKLAAEREDVAALEEASQGAVPAVEQFQSAAGTYGFTDCSEGPHAPEAAPESSTPGIEEGTEEAEEGGVEVLPEEEEVAPEEEAAPEEEVEVEPAPETGGAGGELEEAPAEEEPAPETGSGSGGVGPG